MKDKRKEEKMGKILGAALLGVIVGAAVAEYMNKQRPDLVNNLGDKMKKGLQALKDAFKEGYAQTAKPSETAPAA